MLQKTQRAHTRANQWWSASRRRSLPCPNSQRGRKSGIPNASTAR